MYLSIYSSLNESLRGYSYKLDMVKNDEVMIRYDSEKDVISYYVEFQSLFGETNRMLLSIDSSLKLIYEGTEKVEALAYENARIAVLLATRAEQKAYESDKERYVSHFKNPSPFLKSILEQDTYEEAIDIATRRNKFIDLKNEILEDKESLLELNKSTTQSKCDFELTVNKSQYHEFYFVSLKVKANKSYVVKKIQDLIREYDKEENHVFGKYLTLKICPNSFTDRANKLIELLRKSYLFNDYGFVYDPDVVFEMISLYSNSYVNFIGHTCFVSGEPINASVFINEKGDMTFEPKIQKSSTLFFPGQKKAIALDAKNRTIQVINFENKASLKLYQLGFQVDFDIEPYKDLLDAEFTTFVHKSVRSRIENKDNFDLKINLYISLDLQKNVIFKTDYIYKGEPVERKTLETDFALNNILLEYDFRLEELDLLENGKSKDLETLNKVIISDYSRLKEIADVYLSEEIMRLKKTKLNKIVIKASSGTQWLSVQVSSDQYSQKDLKKILSAYKKKKKFVLLKDDFISLDNKEVLEELANIDETFSLDENLESKDIPIYQIFKLPSFESTENYDIECDKKVIDIIKNIKNFKSTPVSLSDSLLTILRSYQIEAIKWMKTLYDNKLSGILADDMGLGKSIEFISFRTLISENAPTLIVCPKSLIYNWKGEFKKWDKETTCHLIDGNKNQRLEALEKAKDTKDVIIVSYDSLRSDLEEFKKIHFALVCLDEAQYIKNSFTQKSKAVKQLDATSRFALTGTPIENALTDLWSIFDFLMPQYLLSEEKFTKEYVDAFANEDEYARKRLLAKITPFILRRTKDDVLSDLPPKTTEVVSIAMSEKQSELYNAYVLDTIQSMEANPKNKLIVLGALTRLRQICVDPSSFLENYSEVSPKLEYAVNLAQNAISGGHKVLIFSQFTTVLIHLQKLLNKAKIKWLYICGDTKAQDRINIANDFNTSKDINVISVSLKAGGTGLNLHGADTVLHLDPWWNFAVEDQATDRAHRIGQTRPVTVYKLVSHDSIEERVLELQETKKDLYDQVITSGTQNITSISDEDIKFLLS